MTERATRLASPLTSSAQARRGLARYLRGGPHVCSQCHIAGQRKLRRRNLRHGSYSLRLERAHGRGRGMNGSGVQLPPPDGRERLSQGLRRAFPTIISDGFADELLRAIDGADHELWRQRDEETNSAGATY